MQDAMAAFKEVVSSVTVPIVLLFTKRDVLQKNLRVMPFSNYFAKYTGPEDYVRVSAYIATIFQHLHASSRPNGRLQIRFVNATGEFQSSLRGHRKKHSLTTAYD